MMHSDRSAGQQASRPHLRSRAALRTASISARRAPGTSEHFINCRLRSLSYCSPQGNRVSLTACRKDAKAKSLPYRFPPLPLEGTTLSNRLAVSQHPCSAKNGEKKSNAKASVRRQEAALWLRLRPSAAATRLAWGLLLVERPVRRLNT